MTKHLITALALILAASTQAQALPPINVAACTPKIMGGAGVNATIGGGISGAWMSWWCPSTKGPQLRVMAGSWPAIMEATKCINGSAKPTAQALKDCANRPVTSPDLLPLWAPSSQQILASRP